MFCSQKKICSNFTIFGAKSFSCAQIFFRSQFVYKWVKNKCRKEPAGCDISKLSATSCRNATLKIFSGLLVLLSGIRSWQLWKFKFASLADFQRSRAYLRQKTFL